MRLRYGVLPLPCFCHYSSPLFPFFSPALPALPAEMSLISEFACIAFRNGKESTMITSVARYNKEWKKVSTKPASKIAHSKVPRCSFGIIGRVAPREGAASVDSVPARRAETAGRFIGARLSSLLRRWYSLPKTSSQ